MIAGKSHPHPPFLGCCCVGSADSQTGIQNPVEQVPVRRVAALPPHVVVDVHQVAMPDTIDERFRLCCCCCCRRRRCRCRCCGPVDPAHHDVFIQVCDPIAPVYIRVV